MEKATEKQIYFLKTKGIDATNMDKSTASSMISSLKEGNGVPQEAKVVKPGYSKPSVPANSSYYVAYAKDTFCAIVDKVTPDSNLSVPEAKVAFEHIMQTSIDLIKMAREQL